MCRMSRTVVRFGLIRFERGGLTDVGEQARIWLALCRWLCVVSIGVLLAQNELG